MNILIVDDEVSALRDLVRTLKKTAPDAQIKQADRAETALALCREQEFDVAFLDIRMPGKDGLELAKEIKQIRPLINIIMVTAYQQYVYEAVKLYVSDYILKPARAEDIKNTLANLRHPVKDDRKQRTYFSQIVYGLRRKLNELGCEDIFVQSRDSYAVSMEKIPCDYYSALRGDAQVLAPV